MKSVNSKINHIIVFGFIFVSIFGIAINNTLSDVVVILMIIYACIYVLMKRRIKFNLYLVWIMFIMAFILFNLSYTANHENTLKYFMNVANRFIMLIALYQLIDTEDEYIWIINIIVFISLVAVVYSLSNEYGNIQIYGLGKTFGGKIIFSYITIFGTIVAIYKYQKNMTLLNMLTMILLYISCLLTSGRKAMFIPLLFFLIFFLIKNKKNLKKISTTFIIFGLAIITIVYISLEYDILYNIIGYRLESFIISIYGGSIVDESTLLRTNMIKNGLAMFFKKPFLGYGIDSFKVLGGFGVYSHNNYIETLFSGGILYFVIYYSIHAALIIKYSFKRNKTISDIFLFSLLITILIFDIGTITLFIYQINILLLFSTDLLYKPYSIKF